MARPFTAAQADENEAFLAALERCGNARMAAREVGRAHSTLFHRRAGHPDFALRWDAAAVAAHARFHRERKASAGRQYRHGRPPPASGPPAPPPRSARSCRGEDGPQPSSARRGDGRPRHSPSRPGEDLRTLGGEVTIVRTRTGRWQVRLAQPGKLTLAAEQAFLAALSATANVRLSAAAAGASARAFYRRREQKRGFAREMRMALRQGYRRVECAAVAAAQPEALHGTGAWRGNDRPPVPPMTAAQALQLLYLHQKSARLDWDRPHRRRRRGESEATYRLRMMTMWEAEQRAKREDEALRAALAAEPETEAEPGRGRLPPLPALEQVTGWSRASGRPAHDPDRALFGGWRLGHMEAKRRAGG